MKTQLALLAALTLSACDGTAGMNDTISIDDLAVDGKDDSLRAPKFETFTGRDGKTYFHLIAGNGQLVLKSQGYASQQGAEAGIDTVKFNGALPESYQILESKDGQFYFNLLAGNWQVIGTSELYVSQSNAERAVSTVASLIAKATDGLAASGARFQVFKGLDGQYYFHLRAANGEIVLQSQGYSRKTSAVAGISSVSSNGAVASHYQVRDAANGQAYFVLKAANGEVIGMSEMYVSRSNAQRAASAVATLLSTTPVLQ
jgi:uncharacterized protein YegP (UPF0339 family)